MTQGAKGVLAMMTACVVWGLSPLYYAQLKHVPAVEILCYRSLWSLVFFALILTVQRRLSEVCTALSQPRQVVIIFIAAAVIAGNWFGFIHAISNGQGLEASLGFYIFPLVAVVIGRLIFNEKLGIAQWVAICIAAAGVAILTFGLGGAPWIAFLLAGTFGAYGMIKKQLPLGPVVSVTSEVLLLAPLAIAWIAVMGTSVGGANDVGTHALLALSGPLTATPLILFSYAARRARMATVGLVQYLNPTLQFGCAVLVFGEVVTLWHQMAFALIWLGLIIYSISLWRQDRAAAKASSKVAMSGIG